MKAGHPCYFVGFLPEPMPGQTIEDIVRAEAVLLATVIARHTEAEGKPFVIGNRQAGWSIMMVAALRRNRSARLFWPARRCCTGRGSGVSTRCGTLAGYRAAVG